MSAEARRQRSIGSPWRIENPVAEEVISHVTGAIPTLRRGARAGRRFRVPAARCARSSARRATAAPDRRSRPASARGATTRRAALVGARLGVRRRERVPAVVPAPTAASDAAAEDRLDHRDDVSGLGHRDCALLEQPVGPFAARIEGRTRHRKDFAALFAGKPCRDQRTRTARGFDDNDTDRKPRNDAVAARKVMCARFPCKAAFPIWRRLP